MFEHELVAGRSPLVVDGAIYLTEDVERGIVWKDLDGERQLVQLDESDDEWIARMFDEDLTAEG
jgi:hypothetical protein